MNKDFRIMQLKDYYLIYDTRIRDFVKDKHGFYLKYWGYSYAKRDIDKLTRGV